MANDLWKQKRRFSTIYLTDISYLLSIESINAPSPEADVMIVMMISCASKTKQKAMNRTGKLILRAILIKINK